MQKRDLNIWKAHISSLEYCNGPLIGLPVFALVPLQSSLNRQLETSKQSLIHTATPPLKPSASFCSFSEEGSKFLQEDFHGLPPTPHTRTSFPIAFLLPYSAAATLALVFLGHIVTLPPQNFCIWCFLCLLEVSPNIISQWGASWPPYLKLQAPSWNTYVLTVPTLLCFIFLKYFSYFNMLYNPLFVLFDFTHSSISSTKAGSFDCSCFNGTYIPVGDTDSDVFGKD